MRAARAMSAEFCDIIKQGYVKFKGKTVGTWNRRWIILRRASSKGPQRIEKFHDEHDSLGHVGCLEKAILLTSVRSIERPGGDVKKHAVTLCLADGHARTFACSSEYEAEEWVRMLGMVAEMDLISSSSPSSSSSATAQLDLLDSVPDHKLQTDQFYVYLCPNPALQEYGECVMNVTSEDVFLTDIGDVATVIVTWPLNSLRRYGRDGSKFTFESGRRCTTGEGLFVFNTVEGENIYAKVHNATIAISQATAMIRRQQLAASTSNPLSSSSTLPRSASSPASPVSPGCATLPRSPDLAPGYTACPTLSDTPSLSHSHSLPAQLTSPGPAPPPRSALDRPLPPVPRQKRSDPDPAGEYDHIVAGVTVKGGSRKTPPAMPPRRTPSTRSIKDTPLPPTPELNNNNDEKSPRLSSVGEKPGKSGKGKHGNGNHSNDYSSTGTHGDQAATAAAAGASGGDGSSSSDAGVPRMTGDYDLDYIYEEKGLEPQFRKFLQKRKDGEEGDDKGGGL